MEKGLEILAKVKKTLQVPVLTDVHTEAEVPHVAAVVDVLQTPAFLCRQTDFIHAVAQSGKPVNIKKGQFLAPHDMKNVIDKARAAAREKGLPEDNFMACERGASFGYNNLVSDMRSLAIMRETGAPVVYDATHSVQLPGGQGTSSGGMREMVPVLSRAAVAVGVAGLFMETHPDPRNALSDGPNAVPLKHMRALLETCCSWTPSPRGTASSKTVSTLNAFISIAASACQKRAGPDLTTKNLKPASKEDHECHR